MKKLVLALGLSTAAGPLLAEGLAFEPVAPEGIASDRAANVVAFQDSIGPAQLAAMQAEGYSAYGAIAIPVAQAGAPVTIVDLASREEAEAAVLEACEAQTGESCTVIGLIVPAEN